MIAPLLVFIAYIPILPSNVLSRSSSCRSSEDLAVPVPTEEEDCDELVAGLCVQLETINKEAASVSAHIRLLNPKTCKLDISFRSIFSVRISRPGVHITEWAPRSSRAPAWSAVDARNLSPIESHRGRNLLNMLCNKRFKDYALNGVCG